MKQILPGILRLQVVDCSLLPPNVSLKSKANFAYFCVSGHNGNIFRWLPKCEYNIKNDNNSTSEKTILEFLTDEYFPFDEQNVAFIISCASGKSYLIGARESPFPVVNVKRLSVRLRVTRPVFRLKSLGFL